MAKKPDLDRKVVAQNRKARHNYFIEETFEAGLALTRTVLIPFGCVEEHGPHLPLNTDEVVATAVAGVDPAVMGVGPIPAIRKLLERTGLQVGDIDRVELNEAFASQAVACIRELGLDPTRTNVHGGAIALGHPLGASGGRMATTLVRELRRSGGRYGLAAMCVGVGQGIALLVERVDALESSHPAA